MRKQLPLVAAVALALSGLGPAPGTAGAAPGGTAYSVLVMGDSYSAGNGAGEHYGAKGCYRSYNNYGELFARSLAARAGRRTSVKTVACSGATTSAFFEPTGGRPPQAGEANDRYDVIFLTIGGNDLNFDGIVKQCLITFLDHAEECEQLLNKAQHQLDDGTLGRRLRDVVAAVGKKAHASARVVLLGYPYLERFEDYTLTKDNGQPVAVGRLVRGLSRQGDELGRSMIAELNADKAPKPYVFVSTLDLFAGPPSHEPQASGDNPERWFVEPGDSRIPNSFYHPNPRGWWEESELLYRDVRVPKVDIHAYPDWESAT